MLQRCAQALRRRDLIMLLGVTAASPLAARSQQALPVVGFLNGASPQGYASYVTGFLQGLREAGYRECENVAIGYRWAEGGYGRLPELAADLVRRQVALTVANTPAAPTAKAATTMISIVFLSGADPIRAGLVTSLSRPGGNVTGLTFTAFATLLQLEAGALIVLPDAFFIDHRDQIVALAARYNIPAFYPFPSYTTAGGLMSYGTSVTDLFR